MTTNAADIKTVRENLDAETGKYIVHFGKIEGELAKGGKRCTLVVEKDAHGTSPERITLWLDKGEAMPKPQQVIHALVERSKVTNLQNGREYYNADVRTWALD